MQNGSPSQPCCQESDVWSLLESIPDPEIPVLSLVDLGVIRSVRVTNQSIAIQLTPTYSGCPAMKHMEREIQERIGLRCALPLQIETVYFPPWTTAWIRPEARNKLQAYGIAPPEEETEQKAALLGIENKVLCPRCKTKETKMVSQFGSTACKALYQCLSCMQPFDYFKCL